MPDDWLINATPTDACAAAAASTSAAYAALVPSSLLIHALAGQQVMLLVFFHVCPDMQALIIFAAGDTRCT
jgi:hypothetical protein